jgi:hypothetical protein
MTERQVGRARDGSKSQRAERRLSATAVERGSSKAKELEELQTDGLRNNAGAAKHPWVPSSRAAKRSNTSGARAGGA